MDFIFVGLGISVHLVFLFKRELLLDKKYFLILFGITLFIFALSYFFLFVKPGNPSMVALMMSGLGV
jgi:hypothetical protein